MKALLMINSVLKILQHQIMKMDVRESVVLSAVPLFSPDDRLGSQLIK